jgi:hypothetical protein
MGIFDNSLIFKEKTKVKSKQAFPAARVPALTEGVRMPDSGCEQVAPIRLAEMHARAH